MAARNLVNASIPGADLTLLLQSVGAMRTKLPFLVTLQTDDIKSLLKPHKGSAELFDKVTQVINGYPTILPQVLNVAAYNQDLQLVKDLEQIRSQLEQLLDGITNTIYAAQHDALTTAGEVYDAAKKNRDKLPGLNVLVDEMAEYYKKGKRQQPTNTPPATPSTPSSPNE